MEEEKEELIEHISIEVNQEILAIRIRRRTEEETKSKKGWVPLKGKTLPFFSLPSFLDSQLFYLLIILVKSD